MQLHPFPILKQEHQQNYPSLHPALYLQQNDELSQLGDLLHGPEENYMLRIPITLDTTPEDKEHNQDNFMANEVSNLEI